MSRVAVTMHKRIATVVSRHGQPMTVAEIARGMRRPEKHFTGQISRAASYGYIVAVPGDDGLKRYVAGEKA